MSAHTMQVGFQVVPPPFFGGKMGSAWQEAPEIQQGMGPVYIWLIKGALTTCFHHRIVFLLAGGGQTP